ncbi:MAG: DUF2298 domain-containing protein [Anaerolineae bacterium]|nr:DUF2298 domain-containing protein [Anaerolineae bacterium]
MIPLVPWYFVVTLIGLLSFPISYRVFSALPGRGYALARTLGLLLWGYIFWLLSSLGFLANTIGGLFFALVTLAALSLWAWSTTKPGEITAWFKANLAMVFTVELLFLAAFIFMAWIRAMNPNITFTEKPMELAFISASMRAPSMPPHDPWLSGYAISYYYFGYVLVAMLANLTGVSAGVAFNLGVSLVFALTAVGSYGIVYALLVAFRPKMRLRNTLFSMFGPFFILLTSNVEGYLEYLHARGFFWIKDEAGVYTSNFWKWLDIKDLVLPPTLPYTPGSARYLWWWRASRVIQDYDYNGGLREVINEFPVFSFVLSDLHPHVLVMPFAFLGLALALNLLLGGFQGKTSIYKYNFNLEPLTFAAAPLVFGGLAFLNIWEIPLYVGLFAAAYLVTQAQRYGWTWQRFSEFVVLGIVMAVIAALLYLPYFAGFASQAKGLIPNLLFITRGAHLWVVFGTLLLPILSYLVYLWWVHGETQKMGKGLLASLTFAVGLWLFSLLLTVVIIGGMDVLRNYDPVQYPDANALVAGLGAPGIGELFKESLARRYKSSGGWLTLVVGLGLVAGLLWPSRAGRSEEARSKNNAAALPLSHVFVLLMLLFGGLVVLGPEFVYLRDIFGYRINTIFKFYYQAWLLWGTAAAFGVAVLLGELKGLRWIVYSSGLVSVATIGMVYTVMGFSAVTANFEKPETGYNLDGTQHFTYLSPDDFSAVAWLLDAPLGVLAEAVGGQYSGFARISTHSGQPTVIGWGGHETQWRGGEEEKGSREADIALLYTSVDWDQTLYIINRYNIRYIYLGALEHQAYNVYLPKFEVHLTPVFQSGNVTIYEFP